MNNMNESIVKRFKLELNLTDVFTELVQNDFQNIYKESLETHSNEVGLFYSCMSCNKHFICKPIAKD